MPTISSLKPFVWINALIFSLTYVLISSVTVATIIANPLDTNRGVVNTDKNDVDERSCDSVSEFPHSDQTPEAVETPLDQRQIATAKRFTIELAYAYLRKYGYEDRCFGGLRGARLETALESAFLRFQHRMEIDKTGENQENKLGRLLIAQLYNFCGGGNTTIVVCHDDAIVTTDDVNHRYV